ncbi:MAG: hypothetical protein A3E01_15210 [Gammaproteobacteria bacterium RIFCSPHIGHO2_12_FULL_63_22]|nr:MAG: hypothetical protein A3E01_15210 [Gammaproteobacteria bacterium RIFCSPHIGHO2_12_FULL_63_22]
MTAEYVVEVLKTPAWTRVIAQAPDGTYTAVVRFTDGRRSVRLDSYQRVETARYDALAATRKPDGRTPRQRNHGYV